jgi:hypothetical protein
VRRDAHLARDIDTPSDLTHPLVQEVLPPWLLQTQIETTQIQTNPASRVPHGH